MSKVMKQSAFQRTHHKRGSNVSGKFTSQDAYGLYAAPINFRAKELLAKIRQTPSTRYMVVQVNPEMANLSEQQRPTAKAEAAKALFAKYRASK